MASIEETCVSSDHILVGTVQVRLKHSGDDAVSLMDENVSTVREVYQEFSRFKKLDMVSIENAVLGFITALKREASILRIKSKVKSYSEYTYVHASNVSVLSVFQAESLGLKGEILYEIGIAGLLHDVGKMFVSKDILDKDSGLSQNEWDLMKRHPVYGATYLSSLKDAPKLAVVTAFEHHMKFDGSGYPDTRKRGKKQHVVSQMLAVADFFDALRTERPYRKALSLEAIIKLMKDISGKDLNPFLVDNFVASLKRIEAV
jgi:HD-GYP domain-containing protein (c-di-GMP phosphodiesterase class II)